MNKMTPTPLQPNYADNDEGVITISFGELLAAARRQLRVIVACGAVGALIAGIYVVFATPTYQSTARLLIDSTRLANMGDSQNSAMIVAAAATDISVASQLELIRSLNVATLAVKNLDLEGEDKDLVAPSGGPFGAIFGFVRGLFGGGPTPGEDAAARQAAAIDAIKDGTTVVRQPGTFVIDVSYETPYPALSAKVANAVANAYIDEQLSSSFDASQRTIEWVAGQVDELARQANDANLAVERFRNENGLIEADGKLPAESQLADATAQLSLGQTRLAQATATLAQAESVLQSGDMQLIIAAIGTNTTAAAIREQYAQALGREADLATRLGENHEQTVRARSEGAQLAERLKVEFSRIVEGYRSEVTVANGNIKALEQQITTLETIVAKASDNRSKLAELERTAQTYRELHQGVLARQQEAQQKSSFPVSQARVIQDATASNVPASPKKTAALILGLLGGLIVGAGFGFFREVNDRGFRTGRQVTNDLGIGFLGYFPSIRDGSALAPRVHPRSILNYVTLFPLSLAASTMRTARVTVDIATQAPAGKVVAITSAVQGEGKTTVSANFARYIARAKKRVLLIDVDVANPAMSRAMRSPSDYSIFDVIDSSVPFQNAVHVDQESGIHFLGIADGTTSPQANELIISPMMSEFLRAARQHYDYIVIDMPPLAAVAEVRVMTTFADTTLLVVAWSGTDRRTVVKAVEPTLRMGVPFAGAILAKGRIRDIQRYESSDWSPEQYTYHPSKAVAA